MTILTITVQELWFLKDWKMVFPVVSVHLRMNCFTKASQILIWCYWWQNRGQVQKWRFWLLPFRSYGSWKIVKWRFHSRCCIYSWTIQPKLFKFLIYWYWWQNGGQIWYCWFSLSPFISNGSCDIARTQINVNKSGLLSLWQPLVLCSVERVNGPFNLENKNIVLYCIVLSVVEYDFFEIQMVSATQDD